MGNVKPIRDKNAINEIAFVLKFEEFVSSEPFVKKVINLHSEHLKDSLPDYDLTDGVMLQLNARKAEEFRSSKQVGIVCYKQAEENRHEWALRVESNYVVVTCSEYTNWHDVSSKAIAYLERVAKLMDLDENPIVEVNYQCVDKFVSEDEDIQLNDVFNVDSDYLTAHVVKNKPSSWHIYQGWFEGFKPTEASMLHNLNINMHHKSHIQDTGGATERRHELIISHVARNKVQSITGDGEEQSYLSGADAIFVEAHRANKKIIKELVSDKMLKNIGL